jgi:hypothetical protein
LSGHKEVLMTRLRKMMVEELHRRNYSQHTTRYLSLAKIIAVTMLQQRS